MPFKCIYLIGNQAKEQVIGQTKVHLFNIRYLKTCVQRYKKYIIDWNQSDTLTWQLYFLSSLTFGYFFLLYWWKIHCNGIYNQQLWTLFVSLGCLWPQALTDQTHNLLVSVTVRDKKCQKKNQTTFISPFGGFFRDRVGAIISSAQYSSKMSACFTNTCALELKVTGLFNCLMPK